MRNHVWPYKTSAIICDAEKLAQISTIQELGKLSIPLIAISNKKNAIGFYSKYVSNPMHTEIKSYTEEFIDYLINKIPRGVIFYSNDALFTL